VLNLLALVEGHGYGTNNKLYYVEEKGKGKSGMETIDSMGKVYKMLKKFEDDKLLNITVLDSTAPWPVQLNIDGTEAQPLNDDVVFSVDKEGVTYLSDYQSDDQEEEQEQ
jgi:hypothetical protein